MIESSEPKLLLHIVKWEYRPKTNLLNWKTVQSLAVPFKVVRGAQSG
jgi:hypothetical protein